MIRPQPKPPKSAQDAARLDFVRKMPCLIRAYGIGHAGIQTGMCVWNMESEAHHVRKGSLAGVGRKPPANRTIPLCANAHREYHQLGHDTFCAKYGLDLEAHLRRINAEFAKRHGTAKPKTERKKRMKAVLHIVHCDGCTLAHELPWSKVTLLVRPASVGLTFRCINTNQVIEVQ